ncbi:UNVERIFIED_CONTAM: Pentatricopeptide repeat-containing protein, mitochondrial [Sesamum radiatum]|uniref:Pentatricopeptide repeat-containing protein, mitochondrial n=1 Tax=Sesamum radiatum TaxID=300843 RepID=A0AAW2NCP6_SESRA
MPEKSDVTWSSMMAGFVHNELYEEALGLFLRAQRSDTATSMFIISSVLSACSALAALIEGKQVHAVVHKIGFGANEYITSSLVDVYAKCGSIKESHDVFSDAEEKNVVLWNTMISGFARHSRSLEAMILFEKCSRCFCSQMRTGQLNEAKDLIDKMPFEATASIWGSLLASCRVHRNVELAEVAARKLFEIEPNNAGNHVLLSNIYAADGGGRMLHLQGRFLKLVKLRRREARVGSKLKTKFTPSWLGRGLIHRSLRYIKIDNLLDEMEELGFKGYIEHDLHDVKMITRGNY